MVALLGENTLLLMRPSDRGQLAPQLLEEVENMPRDVKPGLTKVKVGTQNQNGQVRFTLPSGDTFLAKSTQQIPAGSTALVNIKADGSPPQVLRVMLPAESGKPAALQQTTSPSVLLGVAKQSQPKVGEPLLLKPAPEATTQSLPQTKEKQTPQQIAKAVKFAESTQTRRIPQLPTPGGQVLGQILTPPSGGAQTLMLANRTPIMVANPPVFEVGSDLTLRITGVDKAVLEKLTLPQNRGNNTQNPAPRQQTSNTEAQRQQISYPNTQQPQASAVSQSGQNRQERPLFQVRPVSPTPPQLKQASQQVTVATIEKNIYTLKTQNGLELKVRPISGGGSESRTANTQAPNNRAQPAGQATINTLTTGSKMSVRFTENGLLDVLRVAEPHNKLHPNLNQKQSGGQTGGQGGDQPGQQSGAKTIQPTTFPAGHIATGSVSQQKPDGRLILQFDQNIKIEVQSQRMLPVGSKLSIHIMPDGHAEIIDISLPKGSERSNTLLRYAVSWDSLNNTLENLARSNPNTYEKMVGSLPRANESLLPQLIQFSNAVANQNLQNMFGDETLNVLRALGLDGMLQTDLSQLHTLQQQRPDSPDSWRALLFPYWDEQDEQAKQGGFFWRRQHKDDSEDAAPDEGTLRFVLNVELSEIGHTQLDGLMQEHQSLYMKLRTQQALGEEEEAGLRSLFTKSLDMLGLNGNIIIKNTQFFDVDPVHDILHAEGGNFEHAPSNQVNVEA